MKLPLLFTFATLHSHTQSSRRELWASSSLQVSRSVSRSRDVHNHVERGCCPSLEYYRELPSDQLCCHCLETKALQGHFSLLPPLSLVLRIHQSFPFLPTGAGDFGNIFPAWPPQLIFRNITSQKTYALGGHVVLQDAHYLIAQAKWQLTSLCMADSIHSLGQHAQ